MHVFLHEKYQPDLTYMLFPLSSKPPHAEYPDVLNSIMQEIPRSTAPHSANEDVLCMISSLIQHDWDVANAALICRDWLYPARRRLYRSLDLNAYSEPKVALLSRTLSTRPHLWTFVSELSFIQDRKYNDAKLQHCKAVMCAVPRLPRGLKILNIRIRAANIHAFEDVSTSLGLSAVTHLKLITPSVRSPRRFKACIDTFHRFLAIPTLTHLDCTFPGLYPLPPMPFMFSLIELRIDSARLRIKSDLDPSHSLAGALLSHPCNRLERLDFRASFPCDGELFTACVLQHAAHLRHLRVWLPNRIPDNRSVCHVIAQCQALETLECGAGAWDLKLLDVLPHTVKTLVLWCSLLDEQAAMLLLDQFRQNQRQLRRITLKHVQFSASTVTLLEEVCRDTGIVLLMDHENHYHPEILL